jgi:hypothetical protein
MKLYEINERLENLLLMDSGIVDLTTGEILTEEAVDELMMEREEKIEACLLFIKNQNAEADALKNEIEKLTRRMRGCLSKADWTKQYVYHQLKGEKFSTPKVSISYRKSKSIEVTDETKIPAEYWKEKREVNKAELKEALLNGLEIDGATIVEKENIVVK